MCTTRHPPRSIGNHFCDAAAVLTKLPTIRRSGGGGRHNIATCLVLYLGLKRKCTRLVVELLGLVELLNASGRLRLDNEHTTQLLDRVPQVWLTRGATVASQTFLVCRLPIESASELKVGQDKNMFFLSYSRTPKKSTRHHRGSGEPKLFNRTSRPASRGCTMLCHEARANNIKHGTLTQTMELSTKKHSVMKHGGNLDETSCQCQRTLHSKYFPGIQNGVLHNLGGETRRMLKPWCQPVQR